MSLASFIGLSFLYNPRGLESDPLRWASVGSNPLDRKRGPTGEGTVLERLAAEAYPKATRMISKSLRSAKKERGASISLGSLIRQPRASLRRSWGVHAVLDCRPF